jgi:GNAT superfamily N-acetyltransferase
MTTRPAALEIRPASLLSTEATTLIAALNAELDALYPEAGANHFRLDADEVGEGRGAFFVAYWNEEPIGCGAIRRIDEHCAEVKRMYVAKEARGHGVSREILKSLEDAARSLGCTRLLLETGRRQSAAVGLYAAAGFVEIPPFGEYIDSPFSLCMAKAL